MSTNFKLGVLFAALLSSAAVFAQAPAATPERIRGDVVSLKGDMLMVHRLGGDVVMVDVKPEVGISALQAATLADAKVGTYVGTPAMTNREGKLIATSMIIFPEAAELLSNLVYESVRRHSYLTHPAPVLRP
ncbi:MAG: hypothetical protein GAK37_03621 [Pseudomonas sp.]|nr:MAG: hypothetical protein GAK37_03621 [Pseudomonas sp.]